MMENKPLTIVSIADIHFGALDPKYTYETLRQQFIFKISNINFDILTICGDLFDAKFMSNNPVISYALLFIILDKLTSGSISSMNVQSISILSVVFLFKVSISDISPFLP